MKREESAPLRCTSLFSLSLSLKNMERVMGEGNGRLVFLPAKAQEAE